MARGLLDTKGAVAVVGAIQILLKDLLLVERALQAECQHRLAQLVGQPTRPWFNHAHKLHGQGGRARARPARPQVQPQGARNRVGIHAVMLEEAVIL